MTIRSTSRALVQSVRSRLANYLVTNGVVAGDDCVQITAAHPTSVPHWTADKEVLVWVQSAQSRAEYFSGGGRHDTRSMRQLAVTCRTRLELDQAGYDPVRLTDASLGHLLLEESVLEALQEHMPTSDGTIDGSALTDCPLSWRHTEGPANDPGPDRSWVYSTLTFSVEYQEDLDTALEMFGELDEEAE